MIKHPHEIVRIMGSQLRYARDAIRHHYKLRHDGRGNACARNWIAEYRRMDRASGYSDALRQIGGAE